MELKHREDLNDREKTDYALAYRRTNSRHLREATIAYNVREDEATIAYCGVINPFIGNISPIELAMICEYWKYMCGGSVEIDRTGGFDVVINKGKENTYYI